MLKKQTLTIVFTYDDRSCEAPSTWDWNTLLDLFPNEEVVIEAKSIPKPVEDES